MAQDRRLSTWRSSIRAPPSPRRSAFPMSPLHAEWPEDVLKRAAARRLHGARRAHPRSEDRRFRAEGGARRRLLLCRRARQPQDACQARRAAAGAGRDAEQIERIHAPIGLDIGAASPAEIAVAVLAEIISALRSRGAGARARRTKRHEIRAGRDRRGGGRDARACHHMPATGACARRIVLTAEDVAVLKAAGVARGRRRGARRRTISTRTTPPTRIAAGMRCRRHRGRSRPRPAASTSMRRRPASSPSTRR